MDGVHDLGGMDGMGPVAHTPDEPAFHTDWERQTFAMVLVTMAQGHYTMDAFRHAIERMDPAEYLDTTYFEHWLAALETLLVETDVLSADRLADRAEAVAAGAADTPTREDPDLAATMRSIIEAGGSSRRGDGDPSFAVGDTVWVREMHPAGHTRCPRYVRGARGTVVAVHGAHVFPDAHAHGDGEQPKPLYGVQFDGRALWGADAEPNTGVAVDLWEPYLEAVEDND